MEGETDRRATPHAPAPRREPVRLLRYENVERVFSATLLVGMVAVTILATANFMQAVWLASGGIIEQQPYTRFQDLFDKALAAIIALELAHSVHESARGRHGLVQVRTVVLIGILAVVRKFVLIDIETASGLLIVGLAAAVLALGTVYGVTHWIDKRLLRSEEDL